MMRGNRAKLPLFEDIEAPKMICFKNMDVIDCGIVLGECHKCGTTNINETRYCEKCGEDLFIPCGPPAKISMEEPK